MTDLELARQDKPITREQLMVMGNEGLEVLNEGFEMKFIDKIYRFLQRRKGLRELCREQWGDSFVQQYDSLNQGIPIGGVIETRAFLDKLDYVKQKWGFK